MKDEIKKITEEFLNKMLVAAEVQVLTNKDGFQLNVIPEEPGMLIGRNGETLKAAETIIRLMVNQKIGRFVNLTLDVAGYKDKRRQEIEEVAQKAAAIVKRTGRVQLLMPMNSYERRVVHLALTDLKDIETESVGVEPNRRVMIKIKKKVFV